nr:ABC transporter A family member 7-like isoform X2 [Malus domestica]
MADTSHGPASFWTQANALLRKNLTFQKRNIKQNIRLVSFPILLCLMLVLVQKLVNNELDKAENRCGCSCIDTNGDGKCEEVCGLEYSSLTQGASCPIPDPPQWPPLLQVPAPKYRAVISDVIPYTDLPNESCKRTGTCPVTVLFTGKNQSLGEVLAGNMFRSSSTLNSSDPDYLARSASGSESMPEYSNFLDPAFFSDLPLYIVQSHCPQNSIFSVPFNTSSIGIQQEARCVQGLHLWRNTSSEINSELYKGYKKSNSERKINEILSAYDFSNSNENNFNVSIWYNSTFKNDTGSAPIALMRLPRSVNLASNAYLQSVQGSSMEMLFEFVKEMPKPETKLRLDFSSLLGTLFFTWVILQLFPVVLTSLVYEKQQKLRIMMKMHGLGDGPYWMISYTYFFTISSIYMLCFVIFGSGIGGWIIVLELYPGFSLYRGLYEFAQYSFNGNYMGTDGMRWGDLSDSDNGMAEVLIIMVVEWFVVLLFAYYVDQAVSSGTGKGTFFCFQRFRKKKLPSLRMRSLQRQGSKVSVEMEKADVVQERERVEKLLLDSDTTHSVICDNLKKVYPGRDGNPEKFAVRGLSLALSRGECFGMLGPNGAGKTSFISMMIGLTKPTSGTAYVQGLDIQTQMDEIYTSMGVCPQHDLLWETLTGREHLLFYGRLKNLKGSVLKQAVEESLKSVNLFHGGVADKQAGKYSGGMKRRLSVAISLIGDPKVVYMDEPSTGLDPASRNNLWTVVKCAKQGRAIILTTHSMEEAEVLCDRLGVFVDGSLQCIGNPKELKARYGGFYVFTMTTSSDHEQEVENMVRSLSPSANRIYHLSGTQKFELPKHEVRIADVFEAVENAKSRFTVFAWGLADTTLEDVFIKVALGAQTSIELT